MRTRNQEYAVRIYQQMSVVDGDARDKYGGMAHELPILVRTAGLAQALGFVESRGSEDQKLLLKHIAEVVGLTEHKLLEQSRESDLHEYMKLTREVLEALVWYKRFAKSLWGVEATGDSEAGASQ